MINSQSSPHAALSRRLLPGLLALAVSLLACSGGASLSSGDATPPPPPGISVPASGTVGFPVDLAVQGGLLGLNYLWTLTGATFQGGAATATGAAVSFTPMVAGPVSLSCVAIKGHIITSQPTPGQLTVVPPSTAAGSFQSAGRLNQARQGLAAAALPDGTVLALGGAATPGGPGLASTEIYNPATKACAFGLPMNFPRAGHVLTRLSTSQFLVTGGTAASTPPAQAETCTFDGTRALFSPSGTMIAANRTGHTATYAAGPPAQVFVAGGLTGAGGPLANSEERYSPAIGGWTAAGTLALAPGHTATLLPTGKILLVTHDVEGRPLAALYDPAGGTFSATQGPPAAAREGHQAILLTSPPKVLILGGRGARGPLRSAEWYDPATGLFSPAAPMASPRADFGLAQLPGGQLLLLGGTADGSTAVATAERYDPVAGTATPTGSMASPRRNPAVVPPPSGKVVVLGGFNETDGSLAGIEVY